MRELADFIAAIAFERCILRMDESPAMSSDLQLAIWAARTWSKA